MDTIATAGPGISFTRQKSASHLMDASREWARRPDDQRFRTLEDLGTYLDSRTATCSEATGSLEHLQVKPEGTDLLFGHDQLGWFSPTNWAFGQVCRIGGAPASYLQKLPAELAASCLQENLHGASSTAAGEETKLLVSFPQDAAPTLRAVTSPTYGRIWDREILRNVERLVERDPSWHVPPAWGGEPAGLYASDRDLFIFMVDGGSVINEPEGFGHRPATLHRGFIVSNSETGSAAFRLTTFLFRVVCGNHIVWDAEDITRLVIRHTSGGPDRFMDQARPALHAYAHASSKLTIEAITRAMQFMLPKPESAKSAGDKPVWEWLQSSPAQFTKAEAADVIDMARNEEGDARTLWQVVNGATAVARSFTHIDRRTDFERRAGKLMKLVA